MSDLFPTISHSNVVGKTKDKLKIPCLHKCAHSLVISHVTAQNFPITFKLMLKKQLANICQ